MISPKKINISVLPAYFVTLYPFTKNDDFHNLKLEKNRPEAIFIAQWRKKRNLTSPIDRFSSDSPGTRVITIFVCFINHSVRQVAEHTKHTMTNR
jgi:hypothetical protein